MKNPPAEIAERLTAEFGQRHSVLDISIREAAELTEIPRATLYYYFGGSDDLASFLLRQQLELLRVDLTGAAHGEGSVVERLQATMRKFATGLSHHSALCADLPLVLHPRGGSKTLMIAAERAVLGPLKELLVEARATGDLVDISPDLASAAIVGSLVEAAMAQVSVAGRVDVDELADQVVPLLMRGLIRDGR